MRTLLCALTFALASTSLAARIDQPLPEFEQLLKERPSALDGRFGIVYALARDEGGSAHPMLGHSVDGASVQVTMRFRAAPSPEELTQLDQLGCTPSRLPSGRIAQVGDVVQGRCSWSALPKVLRLPNLVRVTPTLGGRIVRPQLPPSNIARDVEAVALRQKLHPLKGRGKGVTIADMDSGFDPFHPQFFRADGGAFAWIDSNGNGAFDPLVDAVDFDRNGAAGTNEKLGVIKTQVWSFYTSQTPFVSTGAFEAGFDWLFQDEDGSGVREFGPSFGEAKASFGEQLYVADDVNQNGLLDVNEKVIRLNTHKVKAALVDDGQNPARVYRRGVDLSAFQNPYQGAGQHGTMVMGTLAGADPRYNAYAGIAPDAELLLATTTAQDLVASLAWVQEQGAQLVLWEMATWYWEPLDGSADLEAGCDTATGQGVLNIGAAGNLGGSQKHRVEAHPTGVKSVALEIPANRARYVYGNFNWRGNGADLTFKVTVNGTQVSLTPGQQQVAANGATVYYSRAQSLRGTNMLYFGLYQQSGLPGQTAQFELTNTGPAQDVHGYVADDFTSWSNGAAWSLTSGATDFGTYGTPGVGDDTLAIGTSYADFIPPNETANALANHSGRGPRIDGLDTVDVVVPEDLVTGWAGQLPNGQPAPFGTMMVGGGTSNASPTAVGLLALLKELRPSDSPLTLRDLFVQHTLRRADMGTIPNDSWGYGLGRIYRSQYAGAVPTVSQKPTAAGTITWAPNVQLKLDATASADPESSALQYRWDLDYDGTFEVGPSADKIVNVPAPLQFGKFARFEVFDPEGNVAGALIEIPPPETTGTGGGAGGASGSAIYLAGPKSELGSAASGCGCSQASALMPLALFALGALLRARRRGRG